MPDGTPPPRAFWEALGLNVVWMNASEVARYFLLVKPAMAHDFAEVPGIVPSTPMIALLWCVWDTLLIGVTAAICWLVLDRYGPRRGVAVAAGTLVWAAVFVLLWLGLFNMGLARLGTMAAALPLAWAELAVAGLITAWRMRAAGGVSSRV